MDRAIIRERIAEIESIAGCDLTNAGLDRLEEWFWQGYNAAMPAWVYNSLRTTTADERAYRLGQMTRRVQLQRTLCVGRSRIVKK
jgi:hypothetical protein